MKTAIYDQLTGEKIPVKFRTPHSYIHGQIEKDTEVNDDEDMTVPDMSYSIQDILQKFTKGIDLGISKIPQYNDVQGFDDINPLRNPMFDLSDITQKLSDEGAKEEKSEGEDKASDTASTVDTATKEGATKE